MELLKLLSANEIIAQVLGFLLLLILLRIFAWKRLLKLLDERKERISSEFKKIEEAKLEISGLKADYEAKLSSIEDAAKIKIHEAIVEGRKITEEIKKKAQLQAEEVIADAKANIKYEITKAKEELKEKIVELTIQATENLIQEKLTEENDKQLVKDFLGNIDQMDLK